MELMDAKLILPKSGTVVFLLDESLKLSPQLEKLNKSKEITKALKVSPFFKGKKGQALNIIPASSSLDRVVLLGVGSAAEFNALAALATGGKLSAHANCLELETITLMIEPNTKWKIGSAELLYNLALGAKLRNYRFNKYFVNKKSEHKVFLKKVTLCHDIAKAKEVLKEVHSLADGVFMTRDLVSQPPNILYPYTFAEECKKLEKLGLKVTVLNETEMAKLGMNALLGVGKGSERESRLVVMQWHGHPNGKKQKPIAFVGKGVTFDSGGISIKPATGMGDMKYDMAGAGAVTGLMKTLASRKAKVNAVGVIGIVENMPSGSAQRPSDVVVSMSGQTIEIDNTDAEGRLVLADALWYTQSKFQPEFMINLATLTGAIVIALGENIYGGLFSNNEKLAEKLLKSAETSGEGLWRMPLKDAYDKQINSEIADVKNTGNAKGGGSVTAAHFLQRFVNKFSWAHLDIAGMAWDKAGSDICSKGATGFGVRLLNQLVMDHFEKK